MVQQGSSNPHVFKKNDYILPVFLTALFIFPILFVFRSADDNRLFSWQWVFAGIDAARIFLFLVPGLAVAYLLARVSFLERSPRAFLFLLAFAASAIFWTEPEMIVDASRYFTQAKHLELYGITYFAREWGKDILAWTDLPAVPFLYGLIFRVFGENRLLIEIFTTFLFSMTPVLTYLIGKTLWNEETGFFAGLLLLGMPYLLTQAPLMLVDVPTMFFFTLSVLTFIMALEQGKAWMIVLASCALFLTVFSKYSTWPMLSLLCVIFLIYLKRNAGAALRRCAAVVVLSGLLVGVVAALKFDVISEQIGLLLSYQKPGLGRWGENFVSTLFFQIHPFITIAAIGSLFAAFRKKDANYVMAAWPVVLVAVLEIKRIRYLMPAFPFLALMASYGLGSINSKEVRKFIVYSAVISSLVTATFAYLPFARHMSETNLKNAGEFLNSREIEAVEVLTLPLKDPVVNPSVAVPLLDLFTEKKIVYRYDPALFPPPQDIAISALRFTWEYKNPRYYTAEIAQNNVAVAVISGETGFTLPESLKKRLEGCREVKRFVSASDPFRYKTLISLYIF